MDLYEKCTVQLIVTIAIFNDLQPYASPTTTLQYGTAFVIDRENAILLTNYHVVNDCISVHAMSNRTGRKKLNVRVLRMCPSKDLATLQMEKSDWEILMDSHYMQFDLGDSNVLTSLTEVMVIGYPLAQESVKFTLGIVSGFETVDTHETNIDYDGEIDSYIQTTAFIHAGNSGGPMIERSTGRVIGIVTAGRNDKPDIGYAISTRVIWSVLAQLLVSNTPLRVPRLGLTYCQCVSVLQIRPEWSGLHVNCVAPDSWLAILCADDILHSLSFVDDNNEVFTGQITNDLTVTLAQVSRQVPFIEFVQMIPVNTLVDGEFSRNGQRYKFSIPYTLHALSFDGGARLQLELPEKTWWCIIGGLCVVELHSALAQHVKRRDLVTRHHLCTRRLVVTAIITGTIAYRIHSIDVGDLLYSVNYQPVSTIVELVAALCLSDVLVVHSVDGAVIAIDKTIAVNEDIAACQIHGIDTSNIALLL